MSFEVALGTLGKALDQLSTLKVPALGIGKPPKAANGHTPAPAVVAPKAPAKTAAKTAPKGAKKAPKAVAKAVKAPKAAPAVKAAAKPAKAKPVKAKPADGKVSAVAAGRRAVASGERPKLADAMWIVMGEEQMNSAQVIEALTAKDWMPNAAKPQSYISFVLSANEDKFKRIERGVYQRIEGAGPAQEPASSGKAKKTTKAAAVAAPAVAKAAKAPKKTAAKGTPQGKAERVASTPQATEAEKPVQAATSTEPAAASDPPAPGPSTKEILSRVGLDSDDDNAPTGDLFAEP